VLREKFLRERPNVARHFVEATARAIEWAKSASRDEVIATMRSIISRRGRNEDASVLQYWRSTGVAGTGGMLAERELQMWLDWLVKVGELSPGQLSLAEVYTNELNPYAKQLGLK
jgi:ABC-type nitrate/sulfonate/bicarbonate transport system substrate-binding protein